MRKKINYANVFEELKIQILIGKPILWVRSYEEIRFIEEFEKEVSSKINREIMIWSAFQGLVLREEVEYAEKASGKYDGTWLPDKLFSVILEDQLDLTNKDGKIYILRDFHPFLNPKYTRQLRDIEEVLKNSFKTIVMLSPTIMHGDKKGLPVTLEKSIDIIDFPLPNKKELKKFLDKGIERLQKIENFKSDYSPEEISSIITSLQGLTLEEAKNAIGSSLAHLKEINVQMLLKEKERLIAKSDVLECVNNLPEISDVGGLDVAKSYFNVYSKAFTKEALDFGVEPLKGVLLLGVAGTGKSLLAKTIASLWKVPLLRLDIGKVMHGIIGSSEERMRQVISQAETLAPSILWLDEVEKALSGVKSSNYSDAGTTSRMFGTLLNAMQEGLNGVTIIATANDISQLPPEFIRRFNEVFFVDLPFEDEREANC